MVRRQVLAFVLLFGASVGLVAAPRAVVRAELPESLTDQQFWQMVSDFSEPGGSFRSDNLLSNEIWFQYIIPDLKRDLKPGGVYLGVGPEQNFTYIAALEPRMVVIFDIRRGNLHTQLMYKALFELSSTRAEFVSLLFSRPIPEGLSAKSTAQELFNAFGSAATTESLYQVNFKRLIDHLTKTHKWALSEEDIDGIDYVYRNFQRFGPEINYGSSAGSGGFGGGRGGGMVNYATLMAADDGQGVSRSYLANDTLFAVMRTLERHNLVVPVVGDFAGPKAIRAVGTYLKDAGATVTAFYLSNVEQYLTQNGVWQNFCNNVASLPLTEESTFIYSQGGGRGASRGIGPGGGGRGGGLDSAYRRILPDIRSYGCRAGQ
jgi:hypothetical protein